MYSITLFSLESWFRIIKIYGVRKEINLLKWVTFDSNFKSTVYKFKLGN